MTVYSSSVVVRASALIRAGGFDESPEVTFCEDWDMWIRLSEFGRFARTANPLLKYRVHAGNSGAKLDQYHRILWVIEKNKEAAGVSEQAVARSQAETLLFYGHLNIAKQPREARRLLRRALLLGALGKGDRLRSYYWLFVSLVPTLTGRKGLLQLGRVISDGRRSLRPK